MMMSSRSTGKRLRFEILKRDERRLRTLEALRANAELDLLLAAEAETSAQAPRVKNARA